MKNLFLALMLIFASSAIAGTYDEDVRELLEVTGVRGLYINMNNTVIREMQTGYFFQADEQIDAELLTEAQRKEAGEILKNRFSEMLKKYSDFMDKNISYEDAVNDIYIPLYKEYYSHSEVKELLTFYKSEVGKKSIETSQHITQQAAERAVETYDQKISAFVKVQIEENISIAKKEINTKVK